MDFLGNCRAAHNLAPFNHQRLQAGPGEVAGGHQAVVTAADNDDVVLSHSRLRAGKKLN
jgi:hypothetical protein